MLYKVAVEGCIDHRYRTHSLLSLTSGGKKAISKILVSGEKGNYFLWKPYAHLSESIFILLNDWINGMAPSFQNLVSETNSKCALKK